jgi:Uma2 family endonuclease
MPKSNTLPSGPTWEIAHLFPDQGQWTEEEYLGLDTNRLVEFSKGVLEFPPMPTTSHQLIVVYLYGLLASFVKANNLGVALLAALPIKLWRGKFREPDVVFMAREHMDRMFEQFWQGADLVMEVVSGGKKDRRRDLVEKPVEYARAKIGEYWIVDPQAELINVLRLRGKKYAVHGEFGPGTMATSALLPGFSVDVSAVFAAQLPSRAHGKPGTRRGT